MEKPATTLFPLNLVQRKNAESSTEVKSVDLNVLSLPHGIGTYTLKEPVSEVQSNLLLLKTNKFPLHEVNFCIDFFCSIPAPFIFDEYWLFANSTNHDFRSALQNE